MFRRMAVLTWIALLLLTILFDRHLYIDTDMTAFLPRTSSPAQRVLVDQLRDGVVSRLVLLAIEGVPPDRSAAISKRLAQRLRGGNAFESVENGEDQGFQRDRAFLWTHRYLLSDQIQPDRFTQAGLRRALERDLDDLASTAGFLLQGTLAADPTGEMLHLIEQQLGQGGGPARHDGAWVSPDGSRALMLVRLRAAGADIDAEQQALATIQNEFSRAASTPADSVPANSAPADSAPADSAQARLAITGPPLFAVQARDRIKSDATHLSIIASLLVATALLAVYRSPRILILAFVPVVSGALAGIAAVGLVFHTVHGITLGFGATLIGEAVDYAVYLFTQTTPDSPVEPTLRRIWPTLRLGVLTSVCGFSAMLLSGFDGFAQLGLFTISGLVVAACVTRWVLPGLLPRRFAGVRRSRTMMRIAALAMRARILWPAVVLVTLAAAVSLVHGHAAFWAGDLSSLSPVPPEQQQLDQSLRRDMRAPDAATLVVIRKPDQQAALQAAEHITGLLTPLMGQGALAGIDSPARYLPSIAMQRARQQALPDAAALRNALDAALEGLPFQPNLFDPFLADVEKSRRLTLVNRTDLDGTSLSLKLDALLLHQGSRWVATLSLAGVTAPASISQAIANEPDAVLVRLRAESDRLLGVYLHEGISLAALGSGAIVVLLSISLRSWRRVIMVMAPLAAAVVVTFAVVRLGGHALSIFNLFGVLLVVAIGSNYCLFFDRQRADPAGMPLVFASLLLANACTVMGFGVLALSATPVLHDLGQPVAVGTFLSLIFATILMSPPPPAADPVSRR